MVIDIHCHILPGVDDGARTKESTRRMRKIASKEGINAIVATPHFTCSMSEEEVERVKKIYQSVSEWFENLYLGNELYYVDEVIDALKDGRALTMNGTDYVLIEFPVYIDYNYIENAVRSLIYAGYIPIIAHIERYECMLQVDRVKALVELGAYMQVNVSTITGKLGFKLKFYVLKLLKKQLVHFVATDAHGSQYRKPEMKRCQQYLKRKLGEEKTRRILEENPEKMLKGERI